MHDMTPSAIGTDGDTVIPLHIEELLLTKNRAVRGTIRVEVKTQAREQIVDELLACENVEIERVPIGRSVEAMPDIREEGDTTIIPVVEEIIVTERRLVLKEEVRLRRVRTTNRHTETVVLRSQTADVVRLDATAPGRTPQPED